MLITLRLAPRLAPARGPVEDARVTTRSPRDARGRHAAAFAMFALALLMAPAALAQTAAPPSVDGSVSGALARGDTLRLHVDGTAVGGWQNLHDVEVSVEAGGKVLEQLVFDIENNQLTVGSQSLVIGTGAAAIGNYLRVNGADVVLTTGGAHLSFSTTADVVRDIPVGARFRLSVLDDFGRSVSVSRTLQQPPELGLNWTTVGGVIVAALLAGGLVGNLFASRRRPPPRASLYGTMQRRIDEERRKTAS
jgi:hypothetical protein